MIIGIEEGGQVRVFANLDEAQAGWGASPLDLLSEIIRLYQADGAWLKPHGVYESYRWFPWYKRLRAVTFKPVDAAAEGQDQLAYLLACEAHALAGNDFFASLEALRERYPYEPTDRSG